MASTTIFFSLSFSPENMKALLIFSIIAALAVSFFGTTLALKSSFLLNAPNASAETEALGPLAFYFIRSYGRIST